MKLWVDDVRPAPEGYVWCPTVQSVKNLVEGNEDIVKYGQEESVKWPEGSDNYLFFKELVNLSTIELIDIDHDAGDYASDDGDYIKLLDWLEETGRSYPIHIHSMNPVGVANMRAIIRRNGWTEVK